MERSTSEMDKADLAPYWGILHCHIHSRLCHHLDGFSAEMLEDARSEIRDLHTFAREEMGYDFLSYADHHNMGRMIELGTAGNSPWPVVVEAWRKQNRKGEFVTILGYEYQGERGEYNVYLNRPDLTPNGEVIGEVLASVEPGEEGILFAAHNRPQPTDWDFPHHQNFRIVEIINDGGMPFEQWVLRGLQAGHKVGFIGGSDDHGCRPGRNSSTCVWAHSLSREAVWEALQSRRTVATTGIRPRIWFELNGAPMGSEITCDGPRHIEVTHHFEQRPQWVGIIKNGSLLKEFHPDETEFAFSAKDDGAESEIDFYYLKMIYPDGNYAFASPIWVRSTAETERAVEKQEVPTYCYNLEEEFGERVGRSRWYNTAGLMRGYGFSNSFRDMVCHLGPDPITTLPDDTLVFPTMDSILRMSPDGTEIGEVHRFTPEEKDLVLTALCMVDETLLGAGYLEGKPVVKALTGRPIEVFGEFTPVRQYLYESGFVSPSYVASGGGFFCVLCAREGVLFTPEGKPIGYFQTDYPAFPASVRMRSLDEIYVLGFGGYLTRYSFAAATSGRLMWKRDLGANALSLCLVEDGVLVYNGTTSTHASRPEVRLVTADGSEGERFELDTINRRGTSLTALSDDRLAAMHNPSDRISIVYRDQLNETGTIRLFSRQMRD
jgi:hypothetical protein